MKNLLIYISPTKQLRPEHKKMLEVQIENSLNYWKPEDIILAFNFPYEYKGIKVLEVPDLINSQYPANPRAIINSKIDTIIYLLENKIINELAWFHDFDAFQTAPLDLPPIEKDIGLVRYGFYPERNLKPIPGVDNLKRINCGNIFFKPESLDIFKRVLKKMDRDGLFEEDVFSLIQDEISSRVQIMNQTYNIGARRIRANCEISDKPIRVVHFPPHRPQWFRKVRVLLPIKLIKLIEDKFESKYILVTGAKGFIGSHIVKNFSSVGITEDVTDKEALRPHFQGKEFVIHTAVKKEGTEREVYETNVTGTKNVIELCREYGVKLIYLGTIETKGIYGVTKGVAERAVESSGIKALTLRLPPIYTQEMLPAKHGCFPMVDLIRDIREIVKSHNFNKYEVHEKPAYLH